MQVMVITLLEKLLFSKYYSLISLAMRSSVKRDSSNARMRLALFCMQNDALVLIVECLRLELLTF